MVRLWSPARTGRPDASTELIGVVIDVASRREFVFHNRAELCAFLSDTHRRQHGAPAPSTQPSSCDDP